MSYRLFLWLYFLAIGIAGLWVAVLLAYLSLIFEHNSYTEIAKRQIQNDSIYGSALNENYFSYRLAMIKLQRPDILAIGSSRVGQLKSKYFNASFYTAANSSNNLSEMHQFIQEVLSIYDPQWVILGIDPWWFNKRFPDPSSLSYQTLQGDEIRSEKIKNALWLLLQNKLPIRAEFFHASQISSPYTAKDSLGIRAISSSDGSFVDGSYFYASTLYRPERFQDPAFNNTIWRIQNSHSQFVHGQEVDPARIELFGSIVAMLKAKNIQTIIFFAPIAHGVFEVMDTKFKEKYGYLSRLFLQAKDLGIDNFFNPNLIAGSSDCEFYDGFHGGDITYARILLELSKRHPKFLQSLNLDAITSSIKLKKNHAYSGEHFKNLKELDFLQIGCDKSADR